MKLKKIIASIVATSLVGSAFAMTSVTTASADTIGHAWLAFSNGLAQNWKMEDAGGYIDINGNGSYTLSYDIAPENAAESILFLSISTDINIYQQDATETPLYDEMTFSIDSILVDGVQIAYNGPSAGANNTEDDGSSFRFTIFDEWSSRNIRDIDSQVVNSSNITVNFEVSGTGVENPYQGDCGENATWSFDEETGTLTISGTGEVSPYGYYIVEEDTYYEIENSYIDLFREKIKNVIIEDGISSLNEAFMGCTSLSNITIPNSVTEIGYCAFSNCELLKEITIPNNVIEIGMSAFDGCISLENVKLSENLAYIGNGAFLGCSSLKEITIPSSVMVISSEFLEGIDCAIGYDRDEYTYPEIMEDFTIYGVKGSIAELYAIQSGFNFIEIEGEIPTSGIWEDGYDMNTDSYWNFDKSTGTLTVNDVFYNRNQRYPWYSFKNDIKHIKFIENKNEYIEPSFVENYTSLIEFDIPNSVTYIGDYAFADCTSLTNVTIPNSVTSIGEAAFYDCTSLTDIYFQGTEEEWNTIEIYEYNEDLTNATIHFIGTEKPTITDILNLKKYILGITTDGTGLDFNTDGKVNILDLTTALNNL